MHRDNRKNVNELCKLASRESDPKRLMELIDQMVRLIDDTKPPTPLPPNIKTSD